MLNTVKNVLETIGTATADMARTAAATTASATRTAGHAGMEAAHTARETSLHAAKALGSGAAMIGTAGAKLLKRTPRRTLIGIAATAAAIGGAVYLIQYLRARGEAVHAGKSEEKHGRAHKRGHKKATAHAPN